MEKDKLKIKISRSYFSRAKIFLYCLVSFIVGIGLASFFPSLYLQDDIYWFVSSLLSCLLVIVFWQKLEFRLLGLLALFLFLGIWRYAISLPTVSPDRIDYYNNQKIEFVGAVVSEPDIRSKNQKFKISDVILTETNLSLRGKILIIVNRYPEYNYGDLLQIECEMQAPERINEFAYDRYLARYDIYSVCYYPSVKRLNKDKGNRLLAVIYDFKEVIRNKVNRNLSEPQSSLANGILLGDMRSADKELQTIFSQVGLSHITAVSGMNISILAIVSMSTFIFLGLSRRRAFVLSTVFLVLFVILVGLPASAVRAGTMGFLVLLAFSVGRLSRITNVLFLTAAILLFFNPKLLRDDVGFQLSFLAVFGMVFVYPLLNSFFDKLKIPEVRGVRDILNITLSAQVFTIPVIAYNFSIISLIAPLANLLVLWCIPCLTIGLMVILLLSFLLPVFSFWLFLPADLLLRYIVRIAELHVNFPVAYVEIDYLWPGWIFVYYLLVVSSIIFIKNKLK